MRQRKHRRGTQSFTILPELGSERLRKHFADESPQQVPDDECSHTPRMFRQSWPEGHGLHHALTDEVQETAILIIQEST